MALSDRDYSRAPSLSRGSTRPFSLRVVSVNTWLIIINVAVFIVANLLLVHTTASFTAGRIRLPGVSHAQILAGAVDRSLNPQLPDGYLGHPIYDPASRQLIGYERFTFRPIIEGFAHFSTGKALELQVWRFITFQFLHASLTHLVFNMLGLWFVGSLVEQYLGPRRYLAFYLLCGMAGAALYLLLNAIGYAITVTKPEIIPHTFGLLFNDTYTPLVGASAGVFGVLIAAAFIAPDELVDVLMVIPMKMRTAVYLFLALATANLIFGGKNAGGDAAHVGGAIAGFYFIRHTHLLRDFFQLIGGPKRRPIPASRAGQRTSSEVDRILDKVRDQGLASLTDAERDTLRQSAAR